MRERVPLRIKIQPQPSQPAYRLVKYEVTEFLDNQQMFDVKCRVFIHGLTPARIVCDQSTDEKRTFSIRDVTLALVASTIKFTVPLQTEELLNIDFQLADKQINMPALFRSCVSGIYSDRRKQQMIGLAFLLRVCTLLFKDDKLDDTRESLRAVGLAIQAHLFKNGDTPLVQFPGYSRSPLQYFYTTWSEGLYLNINSTFLLSGQVDWRRFDDVETLIFSSSALLGNYVSNQSNKQHACTVEQLKSKLPRYIETFDESRLCAILLRVCVIACRTSEQNTEIAARLVCLAIQCISGVILSVEPKQVSAHFWCALASFGAHTKYNTTPLLFWDLDIREKLLETPILRLSNTKQLLSSICSIVDEQEDMNTQYNLARYYEHVKCDENNPQKAVDYYKKAAAQNHVNAQYKLVQCYAKGIGVEPNQITAVKYCQQVADQGYTNAQCKLAAWYEHGLGVKQNTLKAFFLYKKAADQGHAIAQNNLARCYKEYITCSADQIPENQKL
jgi:hypothetical protein